MTHKLVFLMLVVLTLSVLLYGCSALHKGSKTSDEKATFSIDKGLLGAELSILYDSDSLEIGENRIELANIKLYIPLNDTEAILLKPGNSISLKAGTIMRGFSISIPPLINSRTFLAGIRPDHRYSLSFDPCCWFCINDMDDWPYEFPEEPVWTDSAGKCPEGMTAMYPGLATDPDDKHRCIPLPRIRLRISASLLEKGPVIVNIGEDIGNEEIKIEKEEGIKYYPFHIVRSGSPEKVTLVQQDEVLWEGNVIFRVKHSYTLEYRPGNPVPLLIHLED